MTAMIRLLVALLALLALTATSWGLSRVALGAAGPAIALSIAAVKALIVAVAFMHLRHAGTATRVAAVVTILFIALLCLGIVADVAVR